MDDIKTKYSDTYEQLLEVDRKRARQAVDDFEKYLSETDKSL